MPSKIASSKAAATRGGRIPSIGALATASGDGVWPAARAAASGSPPGRRQDLVRRTRPVGRLRQAAEDHPLHCRVEVADVGRRLRRRALRIKPPQLRGRRRREGPLAGEHLVQHQAEREQVAAGGHLPAGELLGDMVGGRAGPHVLDRPDGRRQAKVGQPQLATAVDHHVGRLQVPVDHPAVVGRRQARAELPGRLDPLLLRQPADALQQVREVLAVDILHRQYGCPSASPTS